MNFFRHDGFDSVINRAMLMPLTSLFGSSISAYITYITKTNLPTATMSFPITIHTFSEFVFVMTHADNT